MSSQDVLLPMEIESYVDALVPSTFQELGSLRWIDKHTRVEKLTMQGILEAISANREEIVKDMIITYEKLPILVHEIVLIELWREKLFSQLMMKSPKCTFTMYTILYHEATCLNLIETILFHPDSSETLGDAALDLTDYCFRSLNFLLANGSPTDTEETTSEMDSQKRSVSVLLFQIAIKCLTCLRYLIENLDKIPSGVIPRLIVTADTPMLLTQFLIKKPWRRLNKNGDEADYDCDEQRWVELQGAERLLIGKIEAQAWFAIYQLFMHSRIISTYEIHEYRKTQLIKLQSMLNEVNLDQIPILKEFQGWLSQVAMGTFPMGETKSQLLIEMLPPIRTTLELELDKNITNIFKRHCKELLENSQDAMTEKAKILANVYDFEAFESVLAPSKCARCGESAAKKCGRCKSTWYCKRECQVEHWSIHKDFCDKITPK